MDLFVTSAKLTSTPGEDGWAQVHEFTSDDPEKRAKRGSLFAVVATKKIQEGVESVVAGRELISRLHEEYFGNLETSAFTALKNAVEKVNQEFKKTWGDVEIAAVSKIETVVYSAASGGARIVIFRGGMLADIIKSKDDSSVSASGYPQEDDVLILATSKFFEVVPNGSLKAAIVGKELNAASEQLAPMIHLANQSGKIGVVFIKFSSFSQNKVFTKETSEAKEKTSTKIKFPTGRVRIPLSIRKIFRKLPERKIYVRKNVADLETTQSRKVAVSTGAILLLLLIVSIGFGVRQKNIRERRESYESTLLEAKHELEEAMDIFSLNPVQARELFNSSRQKVNELLEQGGEDDELEQLVSSLESGEEDILGLYKTDPELFLDLALLSDGFTGTDMALSEETLFVLDKDGEKVVSVEVANKRSEVIAGPSQVSGATEVAAYSDIALVKADGMFIVGESKERATDKDWEGDSLSYAYAGNIYVLDKNSNSILRYAGIEGGYTSKQDWLAPGIDVDFASVVSITIDGIVWMLTDTGKILKYSLGSPQSFSVTGLTPSFDSPRAIYTNETLEYLYVLDTNNNRVVVLNKDGEYIAQYTSDQIKDKVDFGVSESEKKIILLSGEKLQSIELKHL